METTSPALLSVNLALSSSLLLYSCTQYLDNCYVTIQVPVFVRFLHALSTSAPMYYYGIRFYVQKDTADLRHLRLYSIRQSTVQSFFPGHFFILFQGTNWQKLSGIVKGRVNKWQLSLPQHDVTGGETQQNNRKCLSVVLYKGCGKT